MNRKILVLIFCFVTLLAILALAPSLDKAHFEPGRSFASETSAPPVLLVTPAGQGPETPLWKVILIWALFFITLIVMFSLLPPELRKRVLAYIFRIGLSVLAIYIALRNRPLELPTLPGDPAPAQAPLQLGLSGTQDPVFQPPVMTPWMAYIISLIVTLALLLLAWVAYRFWKRASARQTSSLEMIASIARASLHDIAAGQEFGDVIIQSYVRMGEAVDLKRGIRRKDAMTPREFESRLERAGLPADAVKRLTRLFEAVRYGARKSSRADVNEAVSCLNSILQACGVAQS